MDLFPSLGDPVITGFCILFSYWSIWWVLKRYPKKMFKFLKEKVVEVNKVADSKRRTMKSRFKN